MNHRTRHRLLLAGWISTLGTILYNNWSLALFINMPATLAGATTSELGATGQPHFMLFRWLDIAAGICFIVGASAVTSLATKKWYKLVLLFLVLVLGVSTVAESLIFPLQCSSALSHQCAISEATGDVGWRHQLHITESVISYGLIALLPAIVMVIALRHRLICLWRLSLTVTIYMLLWLLETWFRALHHAASYGFEQRVFIVLFSVWYFVVIRYSVFLRKGGTLK